jgi:hypothetical protein
MTYNRYAPYPPEWDDEPDDVDVVDDLEPPDDSDDFPAYDEKAEAAALARIEARDMETPEGTPVDDIWHAQRAEDRDRFLHPPDRY